MLIKDFRKSEDYFGSIEPGTVFCVDGSFYMAIDLIEEKELSVHFNAVNLDTGGLAYYLDTDLIELVKAELCVS